MLNEKWTLTVKLYIQCYIEQNIYIYKYNITPPPSAVLLYVYACIHVRMNSFIRAFIHCIVPNKWENWRDGMTTIKIKLNCANRRVDNEKLRWIVVFRAWWHSFIFCSVVRLNRCVCIDVVMYSLCVRVGECITAKLGIVNRNHTYTYKINSYFTLSRSFFIKAMVFRLIYWNR